MMKHKHASKVPIGAWIVAFSGLLVVVLLAKYFHQYYEPGKADKTDLLAQFEPERLKRIRNNGLVVVGTSLVQYGFPYDEQFEILAEKRGIAIEFTRISRNSGKPMDFKVLTEFILKSKPRWVFLQAEPFFLELIAERTFYERWLAYIRDNVHFLLKQSVLTILPVSIIQKVLSANLQSTSQNDFGLRLDDVATVEKLNKSGTSYQISPPVFAKHFESFLKQAKQNNIKVILLEMNRSKEGNEAFGQVFRDQFDNTLQQVSKRYHIPLWQFRGDLSLDYYIDRAHLNRKGRALLSDWFLSKLALVYVNDRV